MNISYVRGYRDPHMGLRIWSIVARNVPGLVVMRVPMHIPSRFKYLSGSKAVALAYKLFGHLLLIKRIAHTKSGTVLVREFLTWPLLLISPFLFFQRHRLLFVCQHNIAFAAHNLTHRLILKLLRKIGLRFVLFEESVAWQVVENSNPPAENVRSISMPFPAGVMRKTRSLPDGILTIGFVGNFRKEKSPLWALQAIHAGIASSDKLANCRLIVGTSDLELRSHFAEHAQVMDTSSYASYIAVLCACDVVVLPYEPASYAYRSSGVLAEAVACGCAVVVPDVPTLRQQVFQPMAVGACYSDRADFLSAVQSAVSLVRQGELKAALDAHRIQRGATGVRAAFLGFTQ